MNQTEITKETEEELIERLTNETIQKLEAAGMEERGKRSFLMHLQLELLWQFLQCFPRNERMQFATLLLKRVFEEENSSESQTR